MRDLLGEDLVRLVVIPQQHQRQLRRLVRGQGVDSQLLAMRLVLALVVSLVQSLQA